MYDLGKLPHFIPYPLPPTDPSFSFSNNITVLYGEAMIKLGQLNEMAERSIVSRAFISKLS